MGFSKDFMFKKQYNLAYVNSCEVTWGYVEDTRDYVEVTRGYVKVTESYVEVTGRYAR